MRKRRGVISLTKKPVGDKLSYHCKNRLHSGCAMVSCPCACHEEFHDLTKGVQPTLSQSCDIRPRQ